jgi:hypothetical protein
VPAKLGYTFDAESFAVDYLHESSPAVWPDSRAATARDMTTLAYRVLLCAAAFGCIAYRTRRLAGAVQGGLIALLALLLYLGLSADPPALWPLAMFTSIIPWLPLPGAPPWPAALRLPVALLGTTVLTHAVFFGENRFHVVIVPVLALLAAAALATPSGGARRSA